MSDDDAATYELEEGKALQLDFTKIAKAAAQSPDVIPVAVQNADTLEVLLVAYTNEYAMKHSIETRTATFWSTSKNSLWIKGEGSGNTFELVDIRVNCEQNSLVYLVRPNGEGICHTTNSQGIARDCYYRRLNMDTGALESLDP